MTALRKKSIHAKAAALLVSCFLAVGCATDGVKTGLFGYGPDEVGETKGSFFTGFLNAQNADPLFPSDKAKQIFLISAIDPTKLTDDTAKDPRNLADLELYQLQARLQYALNRVDDNPNRQKQLRNNMQSQLIARSYSVCAAFTSGLQRLQSDSSFFFTSTTALLGGLGAIFAPVATVRALSGAAAITAGVGAAYGSAMFHEKTISVLSKAIESKRKRFYDETIETNRGKSADTYVFGDALRDAAIYHSYCNIVHAFSETEEALAKRDDLETALKGMKKVSDTLDRNSVALNIAKDFTLTTRSIGNAKERKAEMLPKIAKLLSDSSANKTALGALDPKPNEVLLKELQVVESLANQAKTKIEELASQQNEEDAKNIADSLKISFDRWINSSVGQELDVVEKQLGAKHEEAKLLDNTVREGISVASAKFQEAFTKFQEIDNPRTLTLTNNMHTTATVKSIDGLDCTMLNCTRRYPNKSEVKLSIKAKTDGATITPKWSASCPDGKLILNANVTCQVDQ